MGQGQGPVRVTKYTFVCSPPSTEIQSCLGQADEAEVAERVVIRSHLDATVLLTGLPERDHYDYETEVLEAT